MQYRKCKQRCAGLGLRSFTVGKYLDMLTRLDNLIFHYNVEYYSDILKWKQNIWFEWWKFFKIEPISKIVALLTNNINKSIGALCYCRRFGSCYTIITWTSIKIIYNHHCTRLNWDNKSHLNSKYINAFKCPYIYLNRAFFVNCIVTIMSEYFKKIFKLYCSLIL